MFGLSWGRLALGLLVLAVVLGGLWWVVAPLYAGRANKEAAASVTTAAAASTQKGAVETAKVNEHAKGKISVVEERARVVEPAVVGSPDPYREFLAGVCNTELYQGDPVCKQRDGNSRRGGGAP